MVKFKLWQNLQINLKTKYFRTINSSMKNMEWKMFSSSKTIFIIKKQKPGIECDKPVFLFNSKPIFSYIEN